MRTLKWLKFLVGILLLPVCVGAARALWRVLQASGSADTTWIPLLAGAACCLVVYLLLPRPMLIYVFGHELTHAIWTWLCGGRVKRFKASSSGGHVIITRENFLISLAPYFFPVYAVLLAVLFLAGHLIWGLEEQRPWFLLFLGMTYAFHITLTCHVLKTQQSDITSQGYLFSAVIIFLGNVLVLLFSVPLLTRHLGVLTVLRWWFDATMDVCDRIKDLF